MDEKSKSSFQQIQDLIDRGDGVGYAISRINGYEIHCWSSEKKTTYKLYGSFPHHNPKVGSHETVEDLTLEDLQAIKENRFDRKAFDNKIIERHKQYWPYLWGIQ